MYKVVNNRIYITRGDSRSIDFNLLDKSGQEAESDGQLVFTLCRRGNNKPVIVREITDVLVFTPADTKNLTYGEYVWDIQLHYNEGRDTDTVLFGELVVLKEVGV